MKENIDYITVCNGTIKLPIVSYPRIPDFEPVFQKREQKNKGGRPRTRTGAKAEQDWQDYANKEGQWRRK